MGCVFSQTVLSFTPLLSEDNDQGTTNNEEQQSKAMFSKRLRKTSIKFKKMESKTASCITLSCGCKNNTNKLPTIEDAVRTKDKVLLLKIMFDSEDETGWTALDFKNRQCLKSSPVELACQLGYAEIVEIFLENGCSSNLPTQIGRLIHSVLDSMKSKHLMIQDGCNLLKNLLERGCDVNFKDTKGNTTLLYCAELGNVETMNLILPHAVETQFTTRCGGSLYTPLHMSVMKGDFDCVKLLLKYHPKKQINIQDEYESTPLMLSLQSMLSTCSANYPSSNIDQIYSSISIIELLLNAGADPNICKVRQGYSNPDLAIHNIIPLSIALHLTMLEMQTPKQKVWNARFGKEMMTARVYYNNILSDRAYFLNIPPASSYSLDSLSELDVDEAEDENELASTYAGVVRLLIESGTDISCFSKDELYKFYPPVLPLISEIFDFWKRFPNEKPKRLVNISKEVIRRHLGNVKKLHLIDDLPLPKRIRDYVALKSL